MRAFLARIVEKLPLKSLDRYMMRQFAVSYGICTSSMLTFIIVIEAFSRLDKFLKESESAFWVIATYFAATLPIYYCQFLAPVFTLMAVMFTLTMLNKGSELVPMKAAGMSMHRILTPFFLMAALSALSMIIVQEAIVPNFKESIRTALSYGKKGSIKNASFPDNAGHYITVREYFPNKQQGFLAEIRVMHDNGTVKEFWQANEIIWRLSDDGLPGWVLRDGQIQRWDDQARPVRNPDAVGDEVFLAKFSEVYLPTDMRPIDLEFRDRQLPYLSYTELRNQYKRRPHWNLLLVKLHLRFAFPLSNFILLLIGIPFVMRNERRSVLVSIIFVILLSLFYMVTTTSCAELGNRGSLPPILAAWLPVLIFGALGVTLCSDIDSGNA